ncbi:MAG: gliding motility-associated C-terminal domain-containing protein [Bacteroidia bacterium]
MRFTHETLIYEKQCSCRAFVPSAFSPNNDDRNELWRPILECAPQQYSLRIFNRWGMEVFFTNNVENGWGGKSAGNLLPEGTYAYTLRYTPALPILPAETITGTMHLIR